MESTTVTLHYRRNPRQVTLKGQFISPFPVDIELLSPVTTMDGSKTLPVSIYKLSAMPTLEVYAFNGTITSNGEYIMANMHLPNFFQETDPSITGINGLFLISLGDGIDSIIDNSCKAEGKHGCPARILMGSGSSFYFNGMNFYPFMMRDFSVGYYVCDADSQEFDWKRKHGARFNTMYKVGLNYPVVFDATLGIYLTRDADLR